jgi:chromosome partitioning protein
VRSQLNPKLGVLGMVLTRVDPRTSRTNRAIFDLIDASYKDILLPVQIPVSNGVSAAQLEGRDLFDFEPEGRAALGYRDLARCVVDRLSRIPTER